MKTKQFIENKKRRYINLRTEERTTSATEALKWHRAGDRVQVDTIEGYWGALLTSNTIEGAKVETEQERFNRVEGRERCKAIAEELNAYADGYMHKCPECGEEIEFPDGVGDKFKCPHCDYFGDVEEFEELSIYDYFDDFLDIDYTVNRYKEYQSALICIGWGGPNIYIDTDDAYVKLYWGSTREQYPIYYGTRDVIDEWAEELFSCS